MCDWIYVSFCCKMNSLTNTSEGGLKVNESDKTSNKSFSLEVFCNY